MNLPMIDQTAYNNFSYSDSDNRRLLVDARAIEFENPKGYDKQIDKFSIKRSEIEREIVIAKRSIEDAKYTIEKLPSTVTDKNKSKVFDEIKSLNKKIEEENFYITALDKQISELDQEEEKYIENSKEHFINLSKKEIAKVINNNLELMDDYEKLVEGIHKIFQKIETNNRTIQLSIKDRRINLYSKQHEILDYTTFKVNDVIGTLSDFGNNNNRKIEKLIKIIGAN